MVLEVVVITLPIAVETEFPSSGGGESDDIPILWFVEKVGIPL
jgi:hypothetical protein